MTDQKPCRKCQRNIDALAGHCPFCNWDQNATPPPPEVVAAAPPPAVQYKPPEERDVRKLIGIAGAIAVMLVLSFLVGMVINRDGAPDKAPEPAAEAAAEHNAENLKPKRADTPLVPAGEGGIEQAPITSAPAAVPPGQAPDDYARTDATAVSAEEYAAIAQRAKAEQQQKRKMNAVVDPRSITGPAYAQAPRAPVQRRPSPASSTSPSTTPNGARVVRTASVRTRPVPQYQPIPPVSGRGSARFTILVGADGRVKDVNVDQTRIGRATPAVVGAIQNWRFRPATENGRPVSAPYSVEISFDRE